MGRPLFWSSAAYSRLWGIPGGTTPPPIRENDGVSGRGSMTEFEERVEAGKRIVEAVLVSEAIGVLGWKEKNEMPAEEFLVGLQSLNVLVRDRKHVVQFRQGELADNAMPEQRARLEASVREAVVGLR